MAKKNQEDPLEELERAYAHWQDLYENGGSDPTWPDGVNLNLVRSHIIYYKREIEKNCPLYMSDELYLKELPPEVDLNYMAQPDRIRELARQSMQAYLADPNFQYLLRHRNSLSQQESKSLCVGAVLGYARGLEAAIQEDSLVAMRRHGEPDRYLDSFRSCAERVRAALENAEPNLFALAAEDSEAFDMTM